MKLAPRLKFIILFLFLLLIPQKAFAFLSPSTLTYISATIGPTIWYVLVVISVNVVFFIKKIKDLGLIVGTISLIFLIFIGTYYFQTYHFIKKMNVTCDSVPVLRYEIDLNKIPMDELSQYTILRIETSASKMIDTNSVPLNQLDLRFILSNFPLYEKTYPSILDKKKKLLLICENGDVSSWYASFLRGKGYQAYFGRLSRTYRGEFLNKYFKFKKIHPTTSLIIVPYRGEKNTAYINFNFSKEAASELLNSYDLLKQSQRINPDRFSPQSIAGKNIVCDSNFDCLMTKYFLDSQNIIDRKIYKLAIPLKDYIDGNAKNYTLPSDH